MEFYHFYYSMHASVFSLTKSITTRRVNTANISKQFLAREADLYVLKLGKKNYMRKKHFENSRISTFYRLINFADFLEGSSLFEESLLKISKIEVFHLNSNNLTLSSNCDHQTT